MNNLSVSVAGAGNSKIGREPYSSSCLWLTGEKCHVLDVCHMFLKIQFKNIFFDEVVTFSDYCPDYGILAHGCAAGSLVGNYKSSYDSSAACRNNSKSAKS